MSERCDGLWCKQHRQDDAGRQVSAGENTLTCPPTVGADPVRARARSRHLLLG